jgi:hypothetical protein
MLNLNEIIIMGSSISRIDDEFTSYEIFCKKLGEKPKDYKDVQSHTKELIKKHGITNSVWWCPNVT